MRSIQFTIPGTLGGKQRPRFSTKGGIVRTYTAKQTVAHEAIVRHYASEAMRRAKSPLLVGPLKFTMHIYRTSPLSWSKKSRAVAKWITGKPDCDNSAKLALDSMNKIVFTDDSQISILDVTRQYAKTNSVDITVSELA